MVAGVVDTGQNMAVFPDRVIIGQIVMAMRESPDDQVLLDPTKNPSNVLVPVHLNVTYMAPDDDCGMVGAVKLAVYHVIVFPLFHVGVYGPPEADWMTFNVIC